MNRIIAHRRSPGVQARAARVREAEATRPLRLRIPAGPWPVMITTASRMVMVLALVALIGMLPWLSTRSPELTVLRARYAELEATPENLAAIRAELGLDAGPWAIFADWISGVLRGDWGTSWVSGAEVLPGVMRALGVSLSLMGFAILVALIVAALVCVPTIRRGMRGASSSGSGAAAAALTALPEFLLASLLLIVGAVWLGWFPPYGWQGLSYVVLPAMALGIPAGGLVGRLCSDSLSAAFAERWTITWQVAGFSRWRILGNAIRRALPVVMPQIGLVVVGLTGSAVAVERVFSIPGLGRATLGAAESQDIPTLQASVLALLLVALTAGALAGLVRWLLLGPALRLGSLRVPVPIRSRSRADVVVPAVSGGLLVLIVLAGMWRDPFVSIHGRLAEPSLVLPLGADSLGRDVLARVAHGALATVGVAVLIALACFLMGLVIGLAPRASIGAIEVTNAAPPIIAGILVVMLAGPSSWGAAVAVMLVSWAPLAAHTASLVTEAKAQPHISILPTLGVGRLRLMLVYVLPAVVAPVFRHALLRVPGIALALAALGFLGLGAQPPSAEWGLLLSQSLPYVERAPWAVLAPAAMLMLLSVLAVSLSSLPMPRPGSRGRGAIPG